jgi:hypothetical protein
LNGVLTQGVERAPIKKKRACRQATSQTPCQGQLNGVLAQGVELAPIKNVNAGKLPVELHAKAN